MHIWQKHAWIILNPDKSGFRFCTQLVIYQEMAWKIKNQQEGLMDQGRAWQIKGGLMDQEGGLIYKEEDLLDQEEGLTDQGGLMDQNGCLID